MSTNHHKIKDSTSIEHIDYHDKDDTLEIRFCSGATYHYPGCSKDHYHALKEAVSAGKYFYQNLRGTKAVRID